MQPLNYHVEGFKLLFVELNRVDIAFNLFRSSQIDSSLYGHISLHK